MQIKSIQIISVELTQSLKIFTDASKEYGDWEVEPNFKIGLNDDNKYVQNVEIEVIRTIGNQHAKIKVMTSFILELKSKEVAPTTDQDFLEYASFQQVALAHTRAFFIREAMGTKFAGHLLPFDRFYDAFEKIKLAVFNNDRLN